MNIYKGPCSNLSLHKATVGALKLALGNRNIIAESGGPLRNIVIDQTHLWMVFKGSLQQISGIICILVSYVAWTLAEAFHSSLNRHRLFPLTLMSQQSALVFSLFALVACDGLQGHPAGISWRIYRHGAWNKVLIKGRLPTNPSSV
jgi:hypothetical protein